MTFLNPAFLFGLLTIALPVAIHLLSKPRLRKMPWAATRFLLSSVQKNRRRAKMEDLLLLILRALLITLIVLIFTRPAFLTEAFGPEVGSGPSPIVILLDNSASMGQSDASETRFDSARKIIDALVSKLPSGSSCALFLVSDHTKALIPKPTEDFSSLRRILAQATLSDCGSDLYPGLEDAVALLKSTGKPHGEIYAFTDSQAAAWKQLSRIRQLEDENKKSITVHFVTVGDRGEDNLAVSDIQVIGNVVAVNQPVRCAVSVSNWGRDAVDKIPVKLATDDDPPQDEAMIERIEPGASQVVNLIAHFRHPGYHSLTASIPDDRLPSDNQRTVAVSVLEQIRALIVEGTANPEPSERDGFYLRHALTPVRPDQEDSYYLKVTTGKPNELDNPTLTQYELVFLSNVSQLDPQGAQNLGEYVKAGGALFVFPGPTTDLGFYNTDLNFSPLLPANLGPARAPTSQKSLAWQSKDYVHPVTTLWNDPRSGDLGTIQVTKYFPLTAKSGAGHSPRVVVNYANGEPAILEQTAGKGHVFLFSSTATPAWNLLPIHPDFVPLLMRMVFYAISGPGTELSAAPGRPFVFPIDSSYLGKEFSVICPGEKQRRVGGHVEAGEHSAFVSYAQTESAGPYQLFIGEAASPEVVFAVQGDPSESNLVQQPKADIDGLNTSATSNSSQDSSPTSGDKSKMVSTPRVPGREIWYELALAAFVLALLETALAHHSSTSK